MYVNIQYQIQVLRAIQQRLQVNQKKILKNRIHSQKFNPSPSQYVLNSID